MTITTLMRMLKNVQCAYHMITVHSIPCTQGTPRTVNRIGNRTGGPVLDKRRLADGGHVGYTSRRVGR